MLQDFTREMGNRVRALALIGLCAALGCGEKEEGITSPDNTSDGARVYQLDIARYVTVALDGLRVDAILKDASDILQKINGPEDVACETAFVRKAEVGAFTSGEGNVNSETDFRATLAIPGDVKVVHEINWCGGFKANVIGCAPTPGRSFIVRRFQADMEGILWLHEFGHISGLEHRNDPTAVMNELLTSQRRTLNEAECAAMSN